MQKGLIPTDSLYLTLMWDVENPERTVDLDIELVFLKSREFNSRPEKFSRSAAPGKLAEGVVRYGPDEKKQGNKGESLYLNLAKLLDLKLDSVFVLAYINNEPTGFKPISSVLLRLNSSPTGGGIFDASFKTTRRDITTSIRNQLYDRLFLLVLLYDYDLKNWKMHPINSLTNLEDEDEPRRIVENLRAPVDTDNRFVYQRFLSPPDNSQVTPTGGAKKPRSSDFPMEKSCFLCGKNTLRYASGGKLVFEAYLELFLCCGDCFRQLEKIRSIQLLQFTALQYPSNK